MSGEKNSIWRRLLIVPPILIGIGIIAVMVRGKEPPAHTEAREDVTRVRVIEVPQLTLTPRALGFGTVAPAKVWSAVAEVDGKIIEFRDDLRAGEILPRGTVLLRIDPTDYRLAVDRAKADILALKARLAELETRVGNTRASLEIEKRALALNARDLERKRALVERKAVSQAAADQEERNLLAYRLKVQNLENALNLIPAERRQLRAQLAAQEVRLAEAERDLARTVITLPFDARISEVNVEADQVAKLGQTMVRADSIDVAEITAQVQIDKLINLISAENLSGVTPANASAELSRALGLEPLVRLRTGALEAEWPGRVARISDRIDPQTRTVGVVVAVDRPYPIAAQRRDDGIPARPALAKNMYVEVELRGPPQRGRVVIPRAAVHAGRVYVLNGEDRLELRKVSIAFEQEDVLVVGEGLRAGERIVVSDLVPAIAGMKLAPENDEATAAWLGAQAANGGQASGSGAASGGGR